MKGLLVVLVILVIVFAVVTLSKKSVPQASDAPATPTVPIWNQPIPEGTRLVEKGKAKINIEWARRNKGKQSLLEFRVTEKHGYMVDGIRLSFWYRFRDEKTGEWIEDLNKIEYFIKDRLGSGETLTASTPLLENEFRHLGSDLAASSTENWKVGLVSYMRAMEPAD